MKQILAQNPEKIDNATQENRYGHRTNAQRKHAWPAKSGAKNVLTKGGLFAFDARFCNGQNLPKCYRWGS